MKKWLLLTVLIVSQGCAGTREPEEVALLNNSTLTGIVTNSEEIRDDVLAYIEATTHSPYQKRQVKRVARVIQRAILADHGNVESVLIIVDDGSKAIGCLNRSFDNPAQSYKVLTELERYTVNTQARAKAYASYSNALNGRVIQLPSNVTCN